MDVRPGGDGESAPATQVEGFHNIAIFSDDSALVIQFASAFQGSRHRLLLARRRDELLCPEILQFADIVLVDEQMAAIDTWNIAMLARQLIEDGRDVTFIGFVESLTAQLMMKGRELGIDAFLLKSSPVADLAERVDFIARRVPLRAEAVADTPYLDHTNFLRHLREKIEIVEVLPPQSARPAGSGNGGSSPSASSSAQESSQKESSQKGRGTSSPGGGSTSHTATGSTEQSRVTRFRRNSDTERVATDRKHLDLKGMTFGRVRVEKEIGRGGGGVVYSGHHTSLDMRVAVKILYPDLAERNPEFASQFLAEARIAARISNGSVVRVFDCDRDETSGCYYIVMEFVEGTDLQEEIKRSGALSEERLLEIALETASCLMAAEDLGIIHRDIKPANILLTRTQQVKVADLGLAKHVASSGLSSGRLMASGRTSKGPMVGTPYYMSPEQIENASDLDSRTDVYSLGATLYHAAAGSVPFTGEDMGEILFHHLHTEAPLVSDRNSSISPEFGGIVQKMMAKRPRQRYSSLREVYGVMREHRDFLVVRKALEGAETREKTGRRTGMFFRKK